MNIDAEGVVVCTRRVETVPFHQPFLERTAPDRPFGTRISVTRMEFRQGSIETPAREIEMGVTHEGDRGVVIIQSKQRAPCYHCSATRGIEAEEIDARTALITHIRAQVQLGEAQLDGNTTRAERIDSERHHTHPGPALECVQLEH